VADLGAVPGTGRERDGLVVIGGLRRRLEVAHTKLAASRAFLLVAYFTQSHEMLFDAHTQAFAVLGGIPRRGIYDNMRTAVDRVGVGKQRSVNARFECKRPPNSS
jgi:transposase